MTFMYSSSKNNWRNRFISGFDEAAATDQEKAGNVRKQRNRQRLYLDGIPNQFHNVTWNDE